MIFSMIINAGLLFLVGIGVLTILGAKDREHHFRRYEILRSRLRREKRKFFEKIGSENVLEGTAFLISREQYMTAWCFAVAAFLLTGIVCGIKAFITAAFLFLVLGIPLEKAGSFMLPFGRVLQALRRLYIQQKEAEIYDAMTMLRNMAIMKKDRPVTADYMIEGLMSNARHMQPYYLKMIQLIRLNQKKEALESFIADVNTPLAASFGRLLIKLDEINPARLEETIQMHQKTIREERITAHKQRDEMVSDLIYIPVVFNVLLIFINFMLVVYFMQQKEFLSTFIR